MRELSLFSGAGGGLLGTKLLGWRAVGYVEYEAYCQAVLSARIRDGLLDPAPVFGDIRQFVSGGWADRYRGMVDVVTAGFPCQPFSVAGKRAADGDARNLWPETCAVLRAVRPRYALLENVPGLLSAKDQEGVPYFGRILADLSEAGFDVRWTVVGADDVGAPHRRKRLWILAVAASAGRRSAGTAAAVEAGGGWALDQPGRTGGVSAAELVAHAHPERCPERGLPEGKERQGVSDAARRGGVGADPTGCDPGGPDVAGADPSSALWGSDPAEGDEPQSFVGRVAHGVAYRVDRLRALGNGQVPAVVVRAWEELTRCD